MSLDTVLTVYTTALAVIAAVVIGGITLVYMELHAMRSQLAANHAESNKKFDTLRHDLAEEFRAQRAEAAAHVSAIANAIIAASRE